jgi:hypothetical protein
MHPPAAAAAGEGDGAGDGQLCRGLSGVDLGLGFGIVGAFVDLFPRIFNAQAILRRQCLEMPLDGQAATNTGPDAAFGDGRQRKEWRVVDDPPAIQEECSMHGDNQSQRRGAKWGGGYSTMRPTRPPPPKKKKGRHRS